MTQVARITALATSIGADIKALKAADGDLTALTTTAKGNLVAALNELHGLIGSAGAVIDDNAGNGNTNVTWSADKIYDSIAAAIQALKTDIVGGASSAYDTLIELENFIKTNAGAAADLAAAVANRVRYDDAQTLNTAQKLQACQNIGIGDPEHDFLADYVAAKA